MSVTKRIFNNMFWIALSEVSSKGLTFLGTIYLARVLGKAGFGLFSLSLAVGVYFWAVIDMGIMGYGTREVSKNRAGAGELYRSLNSLRFVLAVGLFSLFCAALFLIPIPSEKRLMLIAGCFFTVAYSLCPDWVFGGLEKIQYVALGSIANALIFLAGIYTLVKSAPNVLAASIIYSASYLVESLILIFLLQRKCDIRFFFDISPAKWLKHIRESFYFAINAFFNSIAISIPVFFMGFWSSVEDLGAFSAPHRLTTFITRAGGVAVMALYPVLSNLYTADLDVFKATHSRFQKMIILILMPVCVLLTALRKDIIMLIFGNAYAESSVVFGILVWLSFILLIRYNFGNALLSAGFQRFNMLATGAGAAVIVGASIILIPKYSGFGAALALLLGEVSTLLMMSGLFSKKIYRLNFLDFYFLKVAAAALALGGVIEVLRFPLAAKVSIGAAVYVLLAFLMKIVSSQDITRVYRSLAKR